MGGGGGGGRILENVINCLLSCKIVFSNGYISLELIKINSYSFFSFSCINMACLKMHKLNCCCKI